MDQAPAHVNETDETLLNLPGKEKSREELRRAAFTDHLTGLFNRRYFERILDKEVSRSHRYDHFITFLMIDINGFKEINDRHSHLTGDRVLREVAKLIQATIREADTAIRYGGDEFLVMLPETQERGQAVAGRIREKLGRWNEQGELLDSPLSLAIGVSRWSPEGGRKVEEALKEADQKMYMDKKGGGNGR